MDQRYNWPPQGYGNNQYVHYPPPQQQQQPPNGYQQQQQGQGYVSQYAPMQMQTPMSQGYSQPQPYQNHPQAAIPRPHVQQQQQYQPMPQQMSQPMPQHMSQHMHVHQQPQQQHHHQQPQHQPQHQQYRPQASQQYAQPQSRPQPQVVIPARAPSMPFQMQPPKIRQVQVQIPVQQTKIGGISQFDGTADRPRSYNTPQAPAPAASKPVQRSQSHQENEPRPQQRTVNTPTQNHNQNRAPLHPQSTVQQKAPSLPQTPSVSRVLPQSQTQTQTPTTQHRSPSVQPSTQRKTHPQVVISRTPSSQLTPTKHAQATPRTLPQALPADLSVMLLSAAEEYIQAARGMSSLIVREKNGAHLQMYYKLMATAMGCMDTVLKDFSLMPRDEAKLRLRYVGLLIEETDNTTDIDELISKQISLCGRCRLQDLKYATFHLQARYQFKTNHRAGLKFLDKPISEAETFQHIAWVYAFRFLKVSLTLQTSGRVEAVPALQQLHAIMTHAERRRDRAIYVACSVLEAMVHLRSGAPDRLEQAQRALASARSQQLQLTVKEVGSFGTLIDVVDVACHIQQGIPDNEKSTKLIQAILDENSKIGSQENGMFTVLIEKSSGGNLTQDTGGIFQKSADLRDELVFAWLPKEDLKTLCFHLSALDHNVYQKGMNYVKEAHARSKSVLRSPLSYASPLHLASVQIEWNKALDWHSLIAMSLIACYQEDRSTAHSALDMLKKRSSKNGDDGQTTIKRALTYLSAVVDQRDGSTDSAFAAYSSQDLALPQKGAPASPQADLAALAALNRLLILRDRRHPQHRSASQLLSQIQQACENHPNQYLRMAVRLVTAVFSDEAPINRQKTLTQMASNRANEIEKSTHNREFVVMALCCFTARFFAGQVGEKSVQAAKAARQIARSWHPLWTAVAAGLCMSTFQPNGLIEEAQKAQMLFEAVRPKLPPALRGEDDVDAEGDDDEDEEME